MGTKQIYCLPFLVVAISCSSNKKSKRDYSLKKYAISACLAYGFEKNDIRKEATAAARGYLELGSLPIDAYNQTASAAKQFLKKV